MSPSLGEAPTPTQALISITWPLHTAKSPPRAIMTQSKSIRRPTEGGRVHGEQRCPWRAAGSWRRGAVSPRASRAGESLASMYTLSSQGPHHVEAPSTQGPSKPTHEAIHEALQRYEGQLPEAQLANQSRPPTQRSPDVQLSQGVVVQIVTRTGRGGESCRRCAWSPSNGVKAICTLTHRRVPWPFPPSVPRPFPS